MSTAKRLNEATKIIEELIYVLVLTDDVGEVDRILTIKDAINWLRHNRVCELHNQWAKDMTAEAKRLDLE